MKVFLISLMMAGISHWTSGAMACPKEKKCEKKKAQVVVRTTDGEHAVVAPRIMKKLADAKKNVFVIGGDGEAIVAPKMIKKLAAPKIMKKMDAVGKAMFMLGDAHKGVHIAKPKAAHTAANVWIGTDKKDGRSDRRKYFVKKGDDDKKGKKKSKPAWLGVSIANVPDALAAQLDTEGKGIMIQNVVKGSPADKAGIRIHDVVLYIDEDAIKGSTERAVKLIQDRKAGDDVDIILLRDGKEKVFTVKLGSRDEDESLSWTVEALPEAEILDEIKTRGRIMRRGDDGEWVIEGLADLEKLPGLPDNLRTLIPKSSAHAMQIFTDGGELKVTTRVEEDGNVLVIEQDEDGEITVTRVDEDGEEHEMVYEDMEALEEADEEAFIVLGDTKDTVGLKIDVDGIHDIITDLGDLDIEIPEIEMIEIPDVAFDIEIPDIDFDSEEWQEHLEELKEKAGEWEVHVGDWKAHLEESLQAAREAHKDAMEEYRVLTEEWKEKKGLKDLPHFIWKGEGMPKIPALGVKGKPMHTIDIDDDGEITITIRKGDTELVRRYDNVRQLKKDAPKLYKKYKDLLEEDE